MKKIVLPTNEECSLKGLTQHRHGLPIHSNSLDQLMTAVLVRQPQIVPLLPVRQ